MGINCGSGPFPGSNSAGVSILPMNILTGSSDPFSGSLNGPSTSPFGMEMTPDPFSSFPGPSSVPPTARGQITGLTPREHLLARGLRGLLTSRLLSLSPSTGKTAPPTKESAISDLETYIAFHGSVFSSGGDTGMGSDPMGMGMGMGSPEGNRVGETAARVLQDVRAELQKLKPAAISTP